MSLGVLSISAAFLRNGTTRRTPIFKCATPLGIGTFVRLGLALLVLLFFGNPWLAAQSSVKYEYDQAGRLIRPQGYLTLVVSRAKAFRESFEKYLAA